MDRFEYKVIGIEAIGAQHEVQVADRLEKEINTLAQKGYRLVAAPEKKGIYAIMERKQSLDNKD